jgi:nucleotide-binding universal stress UspA family protein
MKRILCAVDGSKITGRVAACAVELARAAGARLVFLAIDVVPARSRRTHFWGVEMIGAPEAQVNKQLSLAAKAAKAAKFDAFDCVTAAGHDIADAIIAYAEKNRVDHIVLGTHTTSQLARLFLGSVASAVVSHAKMPVTVVK